MDTLFVWLYRENGPSLSVLASDCMLFGCRHNAIAGLNREPGAIERYCHLFLHVYSMLCTTGPNFNKAEEKAIYIYDSPSKALCTEDTPSY